MSRIVTGIGNSDPLWTLLDDPEISDAGYDALYHWSIERPAEFWDALWEFAGVAGPYEAALIGNPVADPEKPIEILRTIHSFDPCLACGVHVLDPQGNEIVKVRVT